MPQIGDYSYERMAFWDGLRWVPDQPATRSASQYGLQQRESMDAIGNQYPSRQHLNLSGRPLPPQADELLLLLGGND